MRTAKGRRVVRRMRKRSVPVGRGRLRIAVVNADVGVVAAHDIGHPHPPRITAPQTLQHDAIVDVVLVPEMANWLTPQVVFGKVPSHGFRRSFVVGERVAKMTPSVFINLIPFRHHTGLRRSERFDERIACLFEAPNCVRSIGPVGQNVRVANMASGGGMA